MMRRVVFAVILFAMTSCSSEKPQDSTTMVQQPSVAGLKPKAQALLTSAWPKMLVAFPGLNKYGPDVKAVQVTDSLDTENPEYSKLTVELLVPEGRSSVPSEYYAFGHHCYVDISPDGNSASVSKRPCKAVLLDRTIVGTEHDNGDDLVVQLR